MLQNYLLIHKSVLPECFELVLKAKKLVEEGTAKDVSEAVRQEGISRSTYYKYKDFVLEPAGMAGDHKAALSMMLKDEAGVLSNVLRILYEAGGSVLTITQSIPIRGKANVTVSLDVSNISQSLKTMLDSLNGAYGIENVHLLALE